MSEEIINQFKNLSDNDRQNLSYYSGLEEIYSIIPDCSDEVAIAINNRSHEAWLKDENYTSLSSFACFLSNAYSDNLIDLEDLNHLSKHDVLEAFYYDDPHLLCDSDKDYDV